MKIIEKNAGTKIGYDLNGTVLSFADGELSLDLARYQRDSTVTKDIMVDSEGNLIMGRGRYYVAQVEIPPIEYEEEVIPAPEREDDSAASERNGDAAGPAVDAGSGEDGGSGETIRRIPLPLNTDDVTLYLFAIDGIVIY